MDYKKRLSKARELLQGHADYMIIGPGSNMFYFTGFMEEPMERPILLILGDDQYIIAPKIYEEQLSSIDMEVRTYNDGEDPYTLANIRSGSLLAIDDQLWSVFLIALLNRFSPSNIIPASTVTKPLRSVKDEEELEIMRAGLKIAEESLVEFSSKIKEGLSECHLAQQLETVFRERGVVPSFSTILTSGPNTSMPHLRCTDRKVHPGEPIIADFGVKYRGYSTDTTRVLSIGKLSNEVQKIWSIVKEAMLSAEESQFGLSGKEIDERARKLISDRGYGKFFIHRTGHGIGIDVHEEPYISTDNKDIISENSVFTIEPGIYIPGKFGIRIEDMVVMRRRLEVLNSLEKEIIMI